MNLQLSSEQQVELISSIVKSIGGIVKLIKSGVKLNSIMEESFGQIFKFLGGSLLLIPDVLVFSGKSGLTKDKLLDSFELMKYAQTNFDLMPDEFFIEWDIFQNNWDNFEKMLKEVWSAENTIFLSLN